LLGGEVTFVLAPEPGPVCAALLTRCPLPLLPQADVPAISRTAIAPARDDLPERLNMVAHATEHAAGCVALFPSTGLRNNRPNL
jgi:hypothetical protein